MENLKHEMQRYLNNAEPVYRAAAELAAENVAPYPAEVYEVATALLQTMTAATGKQYTKLDMYMARVVVKNWVRREQEEREA